MRDKFLSLAVFLWLNISNDELILYACLSTCLACFLCDIVLRVAHEFSVEDILKKGLIDEVFLLKYVNSGDFIGS